MTGVAPEILPVPGIAPGDRVVRCRALVLRAFEAAIVLAPFEAFSLLHAYTSVSKFARDSYHECFWKRGLLAGDENGTRGLACPSFNFPRQVNPLVLI